jgi:hypothetical protein
MTWLAGPWVNPFAGWYNIMFFAVCVGRIVELAKIANFSLPTPHRYRHGIALLRGIDSNKRLLISVHGSSPMR